MSLVTSQPLLEATSLISAIFCSHCWACASHWSWKRYNTLLESIFSWSDVRFEYLSMKLTSYDLDGNNEIVLEEFMYKDEVIFKLEINKFYILIINFEDGVCQYPFSTILDIERMEKRWKRFYLFVYLF